MKLSALILFIPLVFFVLSFVTAVTDDEFTDASIIRSGKFEGINTYGKPWVEGSGTCEALVTRKCASYGQNILSSTNHDYSLSSRSRHQRSIAHGTKHKVSWNAYKCNYDAIDENDPRIGTGTGSHYDPTAYNQRISRNHRDGYQRSFEYYVCSEDPVQRNPLDRIYTPGSISTPSSQTLIDDTGHVIVMNDDIGELDNNRVSSDTYHHRFNQRNRRQTYVQIQQKQKMEEEIFEQQRKRSICGDHTERSPIVCLHTVPEIPAHPDGASYGGRPEINERSKNNPILPHRSSSRHRGSYCTCYHRQDTVGLSKASYSQLNRPTISDDFPLDRKYPTTPNVFSGSADDYFDKPE